VLAICLATVHLGRGLAYLLLSQFATSCVLGRCRTGRTYDLSAPRGTHLCLAPSSVNGFDTAGMEGLGPFQSELKKCLGCSLAVLCLGFCLLYPQSFGVSFCEWLFFVVSCTLHVSRRAVAGESKLTQCSAYLTISGHCI